MSCEFSALEDADDPKEAGLQREKLDLKSMWPICAGADLQPGSNAVPEGGIEGSVSCCSPDGMLLCQVT